MPNLDIVSDLKAAITKLKNQYLADNGSLRYNFKMLHVDEKCRLFSN